MRVLVIDNYDSFTYNLVQLLGDLGAEVLVRRNDACPETVVCALAPDALVISPGPGKPGEAGCSVEIVRRFSGRIPMLGVCLGHQAIAAAFGAGIISAKPLVHGKVSRIRHDDCALFAGIPEEFDATRYHSLVVDERTIDGGELRVAARTRSGLLMALRHERHKTFGLQFHPESVLTFYGPRLVGNFLAIASAG